MPVSTEFNPVVWVVDQASDKPQKRCFVFGGHASPVNPEKHLLGLPFQPDDSRWQPPVRVKQNDPHGCYDWLHIWACGAFFEKPSPIGEIVFVDGRCKCMRLLKLGHP